MLVTTIVLLLLFLLGHVVIGIDICNWDGGIPTLYHEYREPHCPPPNHLDRDYACWGWWNNKQECAAYCQIRTMFIYGHEQPFLRVPTCHGPATCKISQSVHQSYSWKVKANANFKIQALTIGISGGYSKKYATALSYSYSIRLEPSQCGYFAFVAIIRDTCGSYTEATKGKSECMKGTERTVGNACLQQLARFRAEDGFPNDEVTRGIVIFVYTDCVTMEPLPDDKQDPAYRIPGVKLPREVRGGYTHYLKRNSSIFTSETRAGIMCDDSSSPNRAKRLDCIEAMGYLPETPQEQVSAYLKGKSVLVTRAESCSIWITYDADWTSESSCDDANYAEVAAAAQGIYDSCQTNKGVDMGGTSPLRIGKCESKVVITSKYLD